MKPLQSQTERTPEPSPAAEPKHGLFSHLSIRWRLVGCFALFVALLLLLLWFLQVVFLESFYKSIKTTSIKSTAAEIAGAINDEDFYTEVNRLTRQDLICVHIVREDGTPVFTSGNQPSCILHMLLTEQVRLLYRQAEAGGGTVLDDENARILAQSGAMVFLDAAFSVCYDRIRESDRPLVRRNSKEGLQEIFERRRPVYLSRAQITADASLPPAQVTDAVLRAMQQGKE